jgi:hypothetical protein
MKKFYCFLFFIFIKGINSENFIPNENNNITNYSHSDQLTVNQNVETENNNNGVIGDDPGMFNPMEDFDEEAIDAYCVDISNDCEEREHFCQNPAFHETMLERCPRTCNLCKELISRRTTSPTSEEEEEYTFPEIPETPKPAPIIIPSTTAPPLPPPPSMPSSHESTPTISLNQLVGSAENHIFDIESAAMETTTKRTTKKLRARRICRDLASDCNTKLRLCKSTFYSAIMERFCQKSCNFCAEKQTFKKHKVGRPSLPRNRAKISRQTSTGTCLDIGIDCNEKRSLCTHRSYQTLMKRMCPSTCNMCNTM